MTKLIIRYLGLTGIFSALVIAFPVLVWFGAVFVIPYFILVYSPTAFMWGVIFAIPYFSFNWVVPRLAPIIALALTALVVWLVPHKANREALATLRRYHLANVRPTGKIVLQGDVRMEVPNPDWNQSDDPRTFACREQCISMLLVPDVTSVTMSRLVSPDFASVRDGVSKLEKEAMTYRSWPKSKCKDGGRNVDLGTEYSLNAEMIEALATKFCVRMMPPIERYDLLVRTGEWRSKSFNKGFDPQSQENWSFPKDIATANFADVIRADGTVIFRQFNLTARALSSPLYFTTGAMSEKSRFAWGTEVIPKGVPRDWNNAPDDFATALYGVRTSPFGSGRPAWRKSIRAVLASANSELNTSGGQELLQRAIEHWSIELGTPNDEIDPMGDDDFQLLKELLANPDVYDLRGAVVLPKFLSTQQRKILQPIVGLKIATRPARELKNAFQK